MQSRTKRLAQEMVRQAALKLPEPTFLGWRHLLHELNKFVNEHVRKKPDDPLLFVTLQRDPQKDSAVLNVYTGDSESHGFDPKGLVSGVKYFLDEMGVQVQSVYPMPGEPDSVLITVSGLSQFEEPYHHKNMDNTWMRNALQSGEVVDVRMIGVEVEPGVFRLNEFIPDVEYVDAEDEAFIQSIGRDLGSEEVLAAVDDRFYGDEDYECLYRR